MPQLLRVGPYVACLWSNEGSPLEPAHVHIAMGRAVANADAIVASWIEHFGGAKHYC